MSLDLTNRQHEIIEAAGKILTKNGVSGLTIKNLAKEMRFSEAALYRHFSNKESIIISMLEYLSDGMDERFSDAVTGDFTAEEKFIRLFENQFDFFDKHPYFVVAIFPDGLMDESEGINDTIFKIMQVKMKYLMPVIFEGQQKGIFTTTITTEQLIHVVMGTFRLQMFKWRINKFKFDIKTNGNSMIQALLTLIKV